VVTEAECWPVPVMVVRVFLTGAVTPSIPIEEEAHLGQRRQTFNSANQVIEVSPRWTTLPIRGTSVSAKPD
jgi:hypothetical protein